MKDIVEELREIQRMNTTLHGAQMAARAADEIERLRAERDEARRQVCWSDDEHPHVHLVAVMRAEQRGWDCFKVRSEP